MHTPKTERRNEDSSGTTALAGTGAGARLPSDEAPQYSDSVVLALNRAVCYVAVSG